MKKFTAFLAVGAVALAAYTAFVPNAPSVDAPAQATVATQQVSSEQSKKLNLSSKIEKNREGFSKEAPGRRMYTGTPG